MSVKGFNYNGQIHKYLYGALEGAPGDGGESGIFWAVYNTTTEAEITAAVTADKAVLCKISDEIFYLKKKASIGPSGTAWIFTSANSNGSQTNLRFTWVSGSYWNTIGTRTIPTSTSDLTNDSGFQSETQVESKVADVYPTDTASGSNASFPDGADSIPVKDLTVGIEPAQDLHGYDNPWPAGCGVNLLPPFRVQSTTYEGVTLTCNNGEYTLNGTTGDAVAVFDVDIDLPAGQYTASLNNPTANGKVEIYGVDENVSVPLQLTCSTANATATATFSATVKKFRIRVLKNGTVDNFKFSPVLSAGATAVTGFYPYENICPISGWTGATIYHSGADTSDPTTYTIQLGDTVYGGTLDVTSGKLTVDMAIVDMGTLTWNGWEQGGSFIFYSHISDKMPVRDVPCRSSQYAYNGAITGSWSDLLNGELTGQAGGDNVYVRDNRYGSIADFKTAMSGVQLVYPLATPIEYTITPTEVTTLLGTNNIWADTGDSTVEYHASTKLYIDKKIAAAVAAAVNS